MKATIQSFIGNPKEFTPEVIASFGKMGEFFPCLEKDLSDALVWYKEYLLKEIAKDEALEKKYVEVQQDTCESDNDSCYLDDLNELNRDETLMIHKKLNDWYMDITSRLTEPKKLIDPE